MEDSEKAHEELSKLSIVDDVPKTATSSVDKENINVVFVGHVGTIIYS